MVDVVIILNLDVGGFINFCCEKSRIGIVLVKRATCVGAFLLSDWWWGPRQG
jgi:hypothetical protein